MRTLGIDVSHYQDEVNWEQVAQSDVKFAFLKATEGNRMVDARFERNWRQTQEVGLFRGAYHFARPGRDPDTQAVHFASVVGALGFRDLPPVLDLEEDDGHSAAHVLAWTRAFVTKAEALFGRTLIIYTGYFWRGPLGDPKDTFFGERPLWLAAYRPEPLHIPRSWSSWTFWQYTDGRAHRPVPIPGVGPCDQNLFDGSERDLHELCQLGSADTLTDDTAADDPAVIDTTDQRWPGVHLVWPRKPALFGRAVQIWQRRMCDLGYQVDCDGVYGPQCKAACLAFQRDHGLASDGIVGPKTWQALFR